MIIRTWWVIWAVLFHRQFYDVYLYFIYRIQAIFLSVKLSAIKYIHNFWQPSSLFISRTFSSLQTETQYALNNNSPLPSILVPSNLDSILKSRHITLLTKVHIVNAMVFPVVMCGSESWTINKSEHWRINAFIYFFFKWYKWIYLQNRNRFTEIESRLMVTKGEKEWGRWIN